MAVCPNCNAVGKIYGPPSAIAMKAIAHWRTCPSCYRTGVVSGYWRRCDRCKGWGEVGYVINPNPCPECNGRGIVPSIALGELDKRQRKPSMNISFD
jgi:DnaJ-class molecular chaperone